MWRRDAYWAVTMTVSIWWFLFKFFGISTDGFRIAGGVIIFKIGFDMLQARYTPMKLKDEEIKTYDDDISITPLGIPMLCGPGAIANAIAVSYTHLDVYKRQGQMLLYLLSIAGNRRDWVRQSRMRLLRMIIQYWEMCIRDSSCWQGVFICFTKKNLYGLSLKGSGQRFYLKNIPI